MVYYCNNIQESNLCKVVCSLHCNKAASKQLTKKYCTNLFQGKIQLCDTRKKLSNPIAMFIYYSVWSWLLTIYIPNSTCIRHQQWSTALFIVLRLTFLGPGLLATLRPCLSHPRPFTFTACTDRFFWSLYFYFCSGLNLYIVECCQWWWLRNNRLEMLSIPHIIPSHYNNYPSHRHQHQDQ